MWEARSVSRMLWGGLAFSAFAGGASKIVEFSQPGAPITHIVSAGYQPFYIVANLVAFHYCWKIRSDHNDLSTMHTAWLLMAASCAMSILRHAYETVTFLLGWHFSSMANTIVSLRQIPTVLAMVFLTAGLVFMWSSFAAIGLGGRYRARDIVLPVVMIALMAAVLSHRQELPDDRSVYPVMRYFQWSSPVFLVLPALVGLVLERISAEMGGGQFADSLRFLVWSLLLRLASLLTSFTPALSVSAVAILGTAGFWAAPWLFALAVLRRWQMTESLNELSAVYERNPDEGIARLAAGNSARR